MKREALQKIFFVVEMLDVVLSDVNSIDLCLPWPHVVCFSCTCYMLDVYIGAWESSEDLRFAFFHSPPSIEKLMHPQSITGKLSRRITFEGTVKLHNTIKANPYSRKLLLFFPLFVTHKPDKSTIHSLSYINSDSMLQKVPISVYDYIMWVACYSFEQRTLVGIRISGS